MSRHIDDIGKVIPTIILITMLLSIAIIPALANGTSIAGDPLLTSSSDSIELSGLPAFTNVQILFYTEPGALVGSMPTSGTVSDDEGRARFGQPNWLERHRGFIGYYQVVNPTNWGTVYTPYTRFAVAESQELAEVMQATVRYEDVTVAEADGYVSTVACIEVPGLGGMGVHYVNFGLAEDPAVDILTPEALLYVPIDGGFKLVGVEYMTIPLANTTEGPSPWFGPEDNPPPQGWLTTAPTLFGETMEGPMAGHGPGDPWHYDFHVWLWQQNPLGIFVDFNPNISC